MTLRRTSEADVLQALANEIVATIAEPWRSVELIVDYDPAGMIDAQNSYVAENGAVKHLSLSGEYVELIQDLAEAVQNAKSPLFKRFHFTLDSSGKYQARYGYDEVGFPERR